MVIFPAIDIRDGKCVRLFKGDFAQETVYGDKPDEMALKWQALGGEFLHLVDLEGARSGTTANLELIVKIKASTGLFCEVGGGIRDMDTIGKYVDAGIDRVILGTAAVTEPGFAAQAVAKYGEKIAVGIDLKDGMVAIHGWTEKSRWNAMDFCGEMERIGVKTMICTDISRDGAMQGTNRELYRQLSRRFSMDIIASGGVSSLEDIRALRRMELHGAIIGKAYYTGAIRLPEAIEAAK